MHHFKLWREATLIESYILQVAEPSEDVQQATQEGEEE